MLISLAVYVGYPETSEQGKRLRFKERMYTYVASLIYMSLIRSILHKPKCFNCRSIIPIFKLYKNTAITNRECVIPKTYSRFIYDETDGRKINEYVFFKGDK